MHQGLLLWSQANKLLVKSSLLLVHTGCDFAGAMQPDVKQDLSSLHRQTAIAEHFDIFLMLLGNDNKLLVQPGIMFAACKCCFVLPTSMCYGLTVTDAILQRQ